MRRYIWQNVFEIYVVCIVITIKQRLSNGSPNVPYSKAFETNKPILIESIPPITIKFPANGLNQFQHTEYITPIELLYHRIDLVPPKSPLCRHFRQIATTGEHELAFLTKSIG